MADQVEKQEEEQLNQLEALLRAASEVDPKAFEECFSDPDIELVRSRIAKLVLNTAHNLELLQSVKSISTMRELMYNMVATDTKKAKEFHTTHKTKPSDTMKEIKSDAMALAVYSAMYPRKFQDKK